MNQKRADLLRIAVVVLLVLAIFIGSWSIWSVLNKMVKLEKVSQSSSTDSEGKTEIAGSSLISGGAVDFTLIKPQAQTSENK